MLQKLLDETKLVTDFLGLELRQLEVHQTLNGDATGKQIDIDNPARPQETYDKMKEKD